MSKKIVLVGHCGPDSSYLRLAVSSAAKGAKVLAADDSVHLKAVLEEGVDLLLLNRELEFGFDEQSGVEVIEKFGPKYPSVKMMLVSNYPDAQAAAVRAGALPGFGKRELGQPRVAQLIREAIGQLPTTSAPAKG